MTLTGPDISHYQGAVNFAAVRRAGHGFVVLKASEGTTVDPTFVGNRTAARAAGLIVGAYHFARATDPIAEADHFCSTTDPLTAGDLVVLDWEVSGPDPVGWCKAWLDHVATRCNVQPLLYINQATRDAFDWSPVSARYPRSLWLAKYDGNLTQPPSGAWPAVAMKQYTDAATVPGVASPCDCNVFFGDTAALAALGHNPAPAPAPVPAPIQEDGVKTYRNTKTGEVAQCAPNYWRHVSDPAHLKLLLARGLPTEAVEDVADNEFQYFRAQYGPSDPPAPAPSPAPVPLPTA